MLLLLEITLAQLEDFLFADVGIQLSRLKEWSKHGMSVFMVAHTLAA